MSEIEYDETINAVRRAMRWCYREEVTLVLERRMKEFFRGGVVINTLRVPLRWGKSQQKKERYESYLSSYLNTVGDRDNSWLTLVKEDDNPYDRNAVRVMSKGEVFGDVGYIGKEYAERVRAIIDEADKYYVVGNDDALYNQATIEIFYMPRGIYE